MDICYLCQKELHVFMTTPILETPDGKLQQICEECADKNFPGWDDEEDEEDE
jgi:protein-arginine kinase activator protein McsA